MKFQYAFFVNVFFTGSLLAAGVMDFATGRVPNLIVLPASALALLWHVAGEGLSGLVLAVKSGVVAAAPLYLLFRLRAMGGGDVKLMFFVGAWLGMVAAFKVLFLALLFGALAGVVEMVARGQMRTWLKKMMGRPLHEPYRPVFVPFAGAIAAAGLYIVLLTSPGGIFR